MKNNKRSLLLVIAFIASLALAGYLSVGFSGMLFTVAFIGGLVVWLLTTYKTPIDPSTIIVPYILTIIVFIMHVYEEYVFHIEVTLAKMSGMQVSQNQFLIIAAFVAPIMWLLGLVLIFKRIQFGYFLFSTFLFGMMIAELSHFITPFTEPGPFYSPGMYTAILPVIGGWYMFWLVKQEIKKQKKLIH